jgi:predicted HTH domain antitoxin
MTETTFQVHVPTSLLQYGFDREEIERRLTEWLVLSLFTEGHISSGKAARLLNLTRVEFLNRLRARGIVYLDYSSDELAEEFAAVNKLQVEPEK